MCPLPVWLWRLSGFVVQPLSATSMALLPVAELSREVSDAKDIGKFLRHFKLG